MKKPLLKYERQVYKMGIQYIGGVDEAGRGPLVGPVVAACVIMPKNFYAQGLTDSKKLSEKKREYFYKVIQDNAISIGVGTIDAKIIDEVNIYEASKLAMLEAIKKCNMKPEYLLIDAMKLDIDIPQMNIIHGDALSQSIAAASIIAKVTRDKMMIELDKLHPKYGFKNHKGYATKEHLANVKKYGVLDNYRFTFNPIRDLINNVESSEDDDKQTEKNNDKQAV